MKKVLIIQNDVKEGAGQLQQLLRERKIEVEVIFGWNLPPDMAVETIYAGMVILGGTQAVYEKTAHPYLENQIMLCQDIINSGLPILGICLGAQILGAALGGEVKPNAEKEIGWYDLTLTQEAQEDPLLSGYPAVAPAYHFHGDFFNLPPTCIRLAQSEMTYCQVFRFRENVYGFQYHLEVDQALIETMCHNNAEYMNKNGFDANTIIKQSLAHIEQFKHNNATVLNHWIDLLQICRK